MNKAQASKIADDYVERMQQELPVEIRINHDITEEHAAGFVFFYNSKKYWETKNFADALVGNGPLLVLRATGELVILPSYRSVRKSLAEYEQPSGTNHA